MARRPIPRFDHPIIETHCHLDYLKEEPLEDLLAKAAEHGVTEIITIAVEPANLARVREIAAAYPQVRCTQGVHPHQAEDYDHAAEALIVEGLADSNVVAVGEIGLDYYYDHADRKVQRRVFARQLELAAEHDKPVVIHTREADDDTMAILGELGPNVVRRGVIHSFTSSPRLAEFCLDLGFHLGFNGIITFNRAENVREVAALTPIERILLETDSPFLTPAPYRGKENAPHYLPLVAEKVAQIKDLDVEETIAITHANAKKLFGLDSSAP